MGIDFRQSLYALSDIVMNRPPPLRQFDQIYMKLPDVLLQAEVCSRLFDKQSVLFVGDGDAIALAVAHLGAKKLLPHVPSRLTVLDFDERVVNSVNQFAKYHSIDGLIEAYRYNVADVLERRHWQKYDAFYTNPPWGASNGGDSVCCFVRRGIEAVKSSATGCIIIGDHPDFSWTHTVLLSTQKFVADYGFRVAEMFPQFHQYHLDDAPELTSCCMVVRRKGDWDRPYDSKTLTPEILENFYGAGQPLTVRYIQDLRNGTKFSSRDVELIPFPPERVQNARLT